MKTKDKLDKITSMLTELAKDDTEVNGLDNLMAFGKNLTFAYRNEVLNGTYTKHVFVVQCETLMITLIFKTSTSFISLRTCDVELNGVTQKYNLAGNFLYARNGIQRLKLTEDELGQLYSVVVAAYNLLKNKIV